MRQSGGGCRCSGPPPAPQSAWGVEFGALCPSPGAGAHLAQQMGANEAPASLRLLFLLPGARCWTSASPNRPKPPQKFPPLLVRELDGPMERLGGAVGCCGTALVALGTSVALPNLVDASGPGMETPLRKRPSLLAAAQHLPEGR